MATRTVGGSGGILTEVRKDVRKNPLDLRVLAQERERRRAQASTPDANPRGSGDVNAPNKINREQFAELEAKLRSRQAMGNVGRALTPEPEPAAGGDRPQISTGGARPQILAGGARPRISVRDSGSSFQARPRISVRDSGSSVRSRQSLLGAVMNAVNRGSISVEDAPFAYRHLLSRTPTMDRVRNVVQRQRRSERLERLSQIQARLAARRSSMVTAAGAGGGGGGGGGGDDWWTGGCGGLVGLPRRPSFDGRGRVLGTVPGSVETYVIVQDPPPKRKSRKCRKSKSKKSKKSRKSKKGCRSKKGKAKSTKRKARSTKKACRSSRKAPTGRTQRCSAMTKSGKRCTRRTSESTCCPVHRCNDNFPECDVYGDSCERGPLRRRPSSRSSLLSYLL